MMNSGVIQDRQLNSPYNASSSLMSILILDLMDKVNPVRNSSGSLNPAGIILKSNPVAEQRGIISNGVNSAFHVPRRQAQSLFHN